MATPDFPPKKLAFAIDVAGGMSVNDAYAKNIARPNTSPTSITANAYRLMADPEIDGLVHKLRREAYANTVESGRLFIEELLTGYRQIFAAGLERYEDAQGIEQVRSLTAARAALDSMHRLYLSENSEEKMIKLIKGLQDVGEGYQKAIESKDWSEVTNDILRGHAMNKKVGA